MLRLATSIKQGSATASLMLKKLASYPRQNGLAKALRETGRIERTLSMLDWFHDAALRRRVQVALNKGEACNALAHAVFLNRPVDARCCASFSVVQREILVQKADNSCQPPVIFYVCC